MSVDPERPGVFWHRSGREPTQAELKALTKYQHNHPAECPCGPTCPVYGTLEAVQLDPSPQRIHVGDQDCTCSKEAADTLCVVHGDTEGEHPDTCWCSVCAERERRREIEESFLPWHQNVSEVARLLRWLLLHDCAPRPEHTPDLIANAKTWEADYEHMKMWERRRP